MDNDLIREIQKLHEDEQYLQLVQRLLEFDELPAGINVSVVVEAIANTFHSSSPREIEQADALMVRLELKGYLNRDDLDKIFNAIGEAILNTEGEVPFMLVNGLVSSYDERAPENLIKIYARAETREAKNELAYRIGAYCKEQGLLALVDNLYSQQIGNDSIRAILKKHSLLADISLEPAECDAIISIMLDLLETPPPEINSFYDAMKFRVDTINRESAARILVVLNGSPKTSKKSRMRIQNKGDLIVTYVLADASFQYGLYLPKTLNEYLSGHIL